MTNMKNVKLFFAIILGICLLLSFSTCKKYPEGGFEKRGPKIIIRHWKLTLYEVNGIDSTDLINYNGNEDYKKISFDYRQGTYNKDIGCRTNSSLEIPTFFGSGNKTIKFSGGNRSAIICQTLGSNSCYKMIFTPESNNYSFEWEIIKLTKKEIHLKSTFKNSYNIKLKCSS